MVPGPVRGRQGLSRDTRRLLVVQALRAFAYGAGSVLVGVSLADAGLSATRVGAVLTALVAGSALVSVALARYGDRAGRRRCYRLLLATMGLAGAVFAFTDDMAALLLAALTGTVSTDVVESGPFASLEQAMLPESSPDADPRRLFGIYATVATLAGSLGALAAGAPELLREWLPSLPGPQRWLLVYPVAAGLALVAAARLSSAVDGPRARPGTTRPPLHRSRPTVIRLASLFALDSLGGGFVVQAFIAYWFHRKFDASPELLGLVFFAVGILQAGSFQVAVRLAARIGLLRTMVFTHAPSNALLAAVPFAPSLTAAIALLLSRFALSQMDVPVRQAYVMLVVDADERTAAAALTNAARTVVRPAGPLAAGAVLPLAFGAPFVIAGALKTAYDVGLFALFRRVEPLARERSRSRA